MAAPRFLARLAGRTKQVATIAASAGAGDAEKIPSTNASGVLDPTILNAATTGANKVAMFDGTGRLDASVMPVGIGADTKSLEASEALAAGDVVNVWNDGGTQKVRKADATAEGKEAKGFVLSAFAMGASALVYNDGTITGLAGLTPGAYYYLSAASPGGVVAAPPSAAGNVDQQVGWAVSATELSFEPGEPVTLA